MYLQMNGSQENERAYKPISQPKLGKLIKEARKAKKLSQKKLGEQIGVSHQTVATWEQGVRAPIEIKLYRLARALDKPDDFFFLRTPREEVTPSPFCENLRTCRKMRGVTQIQLAEKTGIPLVRIKAYEDRNSGLFVTEEDLDILSKYLCTSTKELLGASLKSEQMQQTPGSLKESYVKKINEAIEKLNMAGLEKAAERISEIATHRRYQKRVFSIIENKEEQ